jgi:superfamily II DNA or RNA helicase
MVKKAKIIIKDECACMIRGLEPPMTRALMKKFEYEIPGARFTPAVKLGRWNGKESFFSVGGGTYINLLPEIIPMLYDSYYDIEIEDIRPYCQNFEFEPINENTFSDRVWPKGHPLEGQPIVLRDYQVEIVNACLSEKQCIRVAGTGAGKTIVTAALSDRVEKYGRSIVIVPNKSLVIQTEADYKNLGLDVGVLFGDRKEYDKTHTICTWQSLDRLVKNTKNYAADVPMDEFLEGVVAVIQDECHLASGASIKSLLTKTFAHVQLRWGLTGTIPKEEHNQRALQISIGPVTGELKASELQKRGVLSSCNVNILQLEEYGEYSDYKSELKYLVTNKNRLDFLAEKIGSIKGNTLVLVDRKATGEYLQELFDGSIFINGDVKAKDRKERFTEIDLSDNSLTFATYGTCSTGISITKLNNLVLIEPGKSFVRVIQSIGRGLRKGHGKDHVEIYDICSSCKFSKGHLTARKKFYSEANYEYKVEKIKWQT